MSERTPLSIPQAAERLGVGKRTVYLMVREGQLPHYRIGPKLIKIDPADIEAYLTRCRVEARV